MASIERRELPSGNISWRVRWYDGSGRLKTRSFKTQREARKYRTGVESVGAAERPRGAGDRITVGEALDLWLAVNEERLTEKTRVVNASAAGRLSSIAAVRVDRATPEAVREAVSELSPHVARQSVNAVKGALRHVQGLGWEVLPSTANMASPRPPETRQRALSIDEVEAVADEIGGHHGEIVRLLAYTGLRVGELAGLEVRDYSPHRGRIKVVRAVSWPKGGAVVGRPKTKAGEREVPVIGAARSIIERRIAERPEEHQHPYAPIVLGARRGSRWNPNNWRRDAGWNRALDSLNLGRVRLHDLRHTYASLVRRAGADVYVLQRVLGHREIATTIDRYGHLYDDEVDELGNALNQALDTWHVQSMPNKH